MSIDRDDGTTAIPEDDDIDVVEVGGEGESGVVGGAEGDEDDAVSALRSELDKAKRERDEATARYRSSEQERDRFRAEADRRGSDEALSHKAVLEQAIVAEQSKAELAEAAYADSLEAGNYAEAAKLQRAMAQSEARISQLQSGVDHITATIEARKSAPKKQSDGFEDFVSTLSKPSQDWVRKHKSDLLSSKSRADMAHAGHIMAENAGIEIDTDEYFAYLDSHMGYSTNTGGGNVPKPVGSANSRGVSAPPSRNNTGGHSSSRVELTKDEKKLAEDLGYTPKEWAEAKMKISSGKSGVEFRSY